MSATITINFVLPYLLNTEYVPTLVKSSYKTYRGEKRTSCEITFTFPDGVSLMESVGVSDYNYGSGDVDDVALSLKSITLDLDVCSYYDEMLSDLGKKHATEDWKYEDWDFETEGISELDNQYLYSVLTVEDLDTDWILNNYVDRCRVSGTGGTGWDDTELVIDNIDDGDFTNVIFTIDSDDFRAFITRLEDGDNYDYDYYNAISDTFEGTWDSEDVVINAVREELFRYFEDGEDPESMLEDSLYEYVARVERREYWLRNARYGDYDTDAWNSEVVYEVDEDELQNLYDDWERNSRLSYDIDESDDYED